MCAKKAKIFNTEKTEQTEIKKAKGNFPSIALSVFSVSIFF